MTGFFGPRGRGGATQSDNRGGPWGPGGGGDDDGSGEGPRNPWTPRRRPSPRGEGSSGPFEDFLKRSRDRFGGGFPTGGRPYWLYGLIAFLALWLVFTSVWRIGPQERGVVTTFGYYSGTLGPGIGYSWPWPIGSVTRLNVGEIQTVSIPGSGENLILTGDQNVIDLAYTVRWNIRSPERYLYQLADADTTIREVAESAMRAAVARVSLDDALGAGRSDIEQRVAQTMQQLLDDYGSGVEIRGVAINQSVPPEAVNQAFLEVSAAQQRAQSAMNNARSYALQRTNIAQGEAAAFDKVYAEYHLAPEVTRRRMYYETMERVFQHVDTTVVEPGVTAYLPLPNAQARPQPQVQAQAQPDPGAAR